jgi:hypothetical protein
MLLDGSEPTADSREALTRSTGVHAVISAAASVADDPRRARAWANSAVAQPAGCTSRGTRRTGPRHHAHATTRASRKEPLARNTCRHLGQASRSGTSRMGGRSDVAIPGASPRPVTARLSTETPQAPPKRSTNASSSSATPCTASAFHAGVWTGLSPRCSGSCWAPASGSRSRRRAGVDPRRAYARVVHPDVWGSGHVGPA